MTSRKKLEEIHRYCAAYLAAEDRTQTEIAETLNISQAAVSRLIKQAKEEGVLSVKFASDRLPAGVMDEVFWTCTGEEYNGKLREFTKHLDDAPRMRVFSSGDPKAGSRRMIETFADNAAPYVRELLLACGKLGVAWGGVLRAVLNSLQKAGPSSRWSDRQVDVVPLAGDPQSEDPADTGSSVIANELSQRINGSLPEVHYSLGMVPAIIPEDFSSEKELAIIRRLIGKVRSYEQIWGRNGEGHKAKSGIVDGLDGIFTSVGTARRPLGWRRESQLLEPGGIIRELPKLAYGDIGGVVIPRDNLRPDQERRLEQGVISRWTGLTIQDLKACFQRALRGGVRSPGVVVICFGEDRADFVFDLLRSQAARPGVINHLVVDQTFANRLLEKIQRADFSPRGTSVPLGGSEAKASRGLKPALQASSSPSPCRTLSVH
jgi:DNA-binding transcriptional regulator LsrR (DeoR family)